MKKFEMAEVMVEEFSVCDVITTDESNSPATPSTPPAPTVNGTPLG